MTSFHDAILELNAALRELRATFLREFGRVFVEPIMRIKPRPRK